MSLGRSAMKLSVTSRHAAAAATTTASSLWRRQPRWSVVVVSSYAVIPLIAMQAAYVPCNTSRCVSRVTHPGVTRVSRVTRRHQYRFFAEAGHIDTMATTLLTLCCVLLTSPTGKSVRSSSTSVYTTHAPFIYDILWHVRNSVMRHAGQTHEVCGDGNLQCGPPEAEIGNPM